MDYLNKLEEAVMNHVYKTAPKSAALVADVSFLAESGPGVRDNRKLKGAARYAAKRARLDAMRENGRRGR